MIPSHKLITHVDILEINVSNVDLEDTIDLFNRAVECGEKWRVCVVPVNCVLWARNNARLKEIYNSADLTLPDGVPLLWASRLFHHKLKGRVTGLDLLPAYAGVAAENGRTFFFLGAKEGVAEYLKCKLQAEHPALNVVGCYSPSYGERFTDEENEKIIAMINAVKPNVLWVSLTAPKQDVWIYENIDRIEANVLIGVGGAFEVTAGLIARAPRWMQWNGLEWAYRLLKEPRRLFKRYCLEAPLFIPLVFLQWMKTVIHHHAGEYR